MPRQPLAVIDEPRIELYEGDFNADMARIGTIKRTDEITGGLSKPPMMPEGAYNLPASACNVGSWLRNWWRSRHADQSEFVFRSVEPK